MFIVNWRHHSFSNIPIAGDKSTNLVSAAGVNKFIIWILDLPLFFGKKEIK